MTAVTRLSATAVTVCLATSAARAADRNTPSALDSRPSSYSAIPETSTESRPNSSCTIRRDSSPTKPWSPRTRQIAIDGAADANAGPGHLVCRR
ncbi:hypothetical protein [Streptomyces eurythermus]|uniref:hypothetical protein n=1 Tax=Streptomyces eurythermus TaxID=42237 RepID=UPI003400D995